MRDPIVIWRDLMEKAKKYHKVKKAPPISHYRKCTKCNKVFPKRGNRYIDSTCTCSLLKFPLQPLKYTWKEREDFIKRFALEDYALPNIGIDLLIQSKILFDTIGVGNFKKNLPKLRAVKVSQIYNWINDNYPKLKVYA